MRYAIARDYGSIIIMNIGPDLLFSGVFEAGPNILTPHQYTVEGNWIVGIEAQGISIKLSECKYRTITTE